MRKVASFVSFAVVDPLRYLKISSVPKNYLKEGLLIRNLNYNERETVV